MKAISTNKHNRNPHGCVVPVLAWEKYWPVECAASMISYPASLLPVALTYTIQDRRKHAYPAELFRCFCRQHIATTVASQLTPVAAATATFPDMTFIRRGCNTRWRGGRRSRRPLPHCFHYVGHFRFRPPAYARQRLSRNARRGERPIWFLDRKGQ